jgi:hypothetical protein
VVSEGPPTLLPFTPACNMVCARRSVPEMLSTRSTTACRAHDLLEAPSGYPDSPSAPELLHSCRKQHQEQRLMRYASVLPFCLLACIAGAGHHAKYGLRCLSVQPKCWRLRPHMLLFEAKCQDGLIWGHLLGCWHRAEAHFSH